MAPDSLSALAQSGRLTDLRLEQTKALLERYSDRLICFQSDTDGAIPVGIDLSDSLLVTKYRVYSPEEGCALGICAHSGIWSKSRCFCSSFWRRDKRAGANQRLFVQ